MLATCRELELDSECTLQKYIYFLSMAVLSVYACALWESLGPGEARNGIGFLLGLELQMAVGATQALGTERGSSGRAAVALSP